MPKNTEKMREVWREFARIAPDAVTAERLDEARAATASFAATNRAEELLLVIIEDLRSPEGVDRQKPLDPEFLEYAAACREIWSKAPCPTTNHQII